MAVKKSNQSCNYGDDCPPGYWCNNGTCVPQAKKPGPFSSTSAKIGAGIIGAGIGAIGTRVAKNIAEKRKAKNEIKKTVDETVKKVTSNVMKKGGTIKKISMVKKSTTTKKKK